MNNVQPTPPTNTHTLFFLSCLFTISIFAVLTIVSPYHQLFFKVFCVEGTGFHCFRTNLGTMFIELSYSQSNSSDCFTLFFLWAMDREVQTYLEFFTSSWLHLFSHLLIHDVEFFKAMKSVSYLGSFCVHYAY